MMTQFYPCGLNLITTNNSMVSLDCNRAGVSSASSSRITICGTVAKIQLPVRTILLLDTPDFEMLLTNGL